MDYWILFNKGGGGGFVCAESQTWILDAPNTKLPLQQSGFRMLGMGKSINLRTHLALFGK